MCAGVTHRGVIHLGQQEEVQEVQDQSRDPQEKLQVLHLDQDPTQSSHLHLHLAAAAEMIARLAAAAARTATALQAVLLLAMLLAAAGRSAASWAGYSACWVVFAW